MKKVFHNQNVDELNLKNVRSLGQAEPAENPYSIPNEAGCSAEFSDGCIFAE